MLAARLVRPCDGPGADPWVRDARDRVTSYDALFAFAVELYGPPVGCDGAVTDDFDGAAFGNVVMSFTGGATFELETLPPETSVVTLAAPSGFADAARVRRVVEAYAAGMGLAIDWNAPEVTTQGAEVVQSFWDPDPGLNASASLVFADGKLVAVRVSMAL